MNNNPFIIQNIWLVGLIELATIIVAFILHFVHSAPQRFSLSQGIKANMFALAHTSVFVCVTVDVYNLLLNMAWNESVKAVTVVVTGIAFSIALQIIARIQANRVWP